MQNAMKMNRAVPSSEKFHEEISTFITHKILVVNKTPSVIYKKPDPFIREVCKKNLGEYLPVARSIPTGILVLLYFA